jgi:hypothetical protein
MTGDLYRAAWKRTVGTRTTVVTHGTPTADYATAEDQRAAQVRADRDGTLKDSWVELLPAEAWQRVRKHRDCATCGLWTPGLWPAPCSDCGYHGTSNDRETVAA